MLFDRLSLSDAPVVLSEARLPRINLVTQPRAPIGTVRIRYQELEDLAAALVAKARERRNAGLPSRIAL